MGQAASTIFRCISSSSCCGGGFGGGDDAKHQHHPGLGGILQFEEEIRQSKTLHLLGNPLVLEPTIPTPQQPCQDLTVRQGLVAYSPTFISNPTTYGSPDLLSLDINVVSDDEEEEDEVIWEVGALRTGVVWICHYCSSYKILLVGEGDFSFSASLAAAFGTACNITATSLDSIGFLKSNYKNAARNISRLEDKGATVMHGIDATQMADYPALECRTFDRIIYNFPHSGFFGKEPRQSQLLRHRKLVRLFMRNAKKMIWDGGEVHITHKSNGFFLEWNLKQLALMEGLRFIEEVHFNFREYPGYRTKYGFGGDQNFNCNPSKTYKFCL